MKVETTQKNRYKKYVIDPRLKYYKPHSTKVTKTFAQEISAGLTDMPKHIPSMFFYDIKGSELFEKICELSEYYVTRTEIDILGKMKEELQSYLNGPVRIVELGSGMSIKTRTILDAVLNFQDTVEYIPIDVSDILAESSEQLLCDYDNLHITGIIDTYQGGLEFLQNYGKEKSIILFLGSSFGNFTPEQGKEFLLDIYQMMRAGDIFMIGLDLVKDKDILEPAYDDSKGVTKRFNLNMLSRINNELDANFELKDFSHHSFYNDEQQRIEMHLKSKINQTITIPQCSLQIDIKKDELIHTEYSYKFTQYQIRQMLSNAGFVINQIWLDNNRYFSVILASKKHLPGASKSR